MTASTVLRASALTDTHPELPSDWRRTIGDLLAHGYPWPCETCQKPSYQMFRCSRCGRDLVQ